MVTNKQPIIYWKIASLAVLLALGVFTAVNGHAATVWTGPNINYTKSASTPADTIVAGKVVLKRGSSEVLFNTAAGEQFAGINSPADTEWAFGTINNFASLTYQSMGSMRNTAGGNLSAKLLNKDMVLHLINEDIYLSIKFTAWGRFGSGTVAYTRSTAGTVTPPSPTVSITSPANGATFPAPADVPISADASVSSGTVTNVSFFNGTTLLGSVQTSPFNFTATGLQVGAYSLTAVATAAGISSTSSVVAITVTASTPPSPTVNITSPASGATFTAPADVPISADAAVSSGTVTNVSFFNGTTLLGSAQTAPFNFTATGLQAGAYSLTAVATAAGISSTSALVAITVSAATPPSPTVSITSPTNGATFTVPADVAISANASVSSGTVTNVSFFNGTTLLGSVGAAPFNFTATGLQAGAYSLTAVATAAGISSTSAVVAFTVISTGSIQLTVPAVSNGVFSFSYSANSGLSYVVAGSFDLFNWQPLATNVASGNSVLFSEPVGTNSSRFYRVGRVPGP
jgi:hypothetical protein